ncbi:hypothetical protein [Nannocystis pusilla]|uniref:Uncharacterized protein n=1 Tax=Nannocystis pusilla TaxID=889268 RepID=A0ABS7U402_9BACT|nr:hypothetical protein [Nannocystis pusilla]MBZ5715267.1 hypothetical protein [Nannocystis pusilla]
MKRKSKFDASKLTDAQVSAASTEYHRRRIRKEIQRAKHTLSLVLDRLGESAHAARAYSVAKVAHHILADVVDGKSDNEIAQSVHGLLEEARQDDAHLYRRLCEPDPV